MSQADLLVSAIKKILKRDGITYASLAPGLGLSESAIKRMFSEGNFTIKRLNDICELVGVSFSDLIRIMEKEDIKTDQLTISQEKQLASDERLLLVAFLVINGFKMKDILDAYHFTEHEVIHYLAQLDKLKIIELLPFNRIKLFISSKFSWRQDGPIQHFFTKRLQEDFLSSTFSKEEEKHYFLTAMFSRKNALELQKQIENLVSQFKTRNLDDYPNQRNDKEIYSLLIAMRKWQPHIFDHLRRSS